MEPRSPAKEPEDGEVTGWKMPERARFPPHDLDMRDKDDKPAKRPRTARADDQARGRRMFGNILGTLRKFEDDDKKSKHSEAAKRREETSARIAEKLRSEKSAREDLAASERELRTLRLQNENATFVLGQREIAMRARHRTLRSASRYLSTTSTPGPVREGALFTTFPAPAAQARGPGTGLTSLYFLPKELLPHQEEAVRVRGEEIRRTIDEEEDALERDRAEAEVKGRENRVKIEQLEDKVRRLREVKSLAQAAETVRSRREEPGSRSRRDSGRERSERRNSVSPEPSPPPPRRGRYDDEMEVEY